LIWLWAFPGFVIVVILSWIVSRIRAYRRFFSDAHFLEVSQGVPPLKAAALDRMIAPNNKDEALAPSDPRILVTSAGVAFFYTIQHVENRFIHHYSVSEAGRITAAALGETYTLFVAKLLGVPFETLKLGMGQSGVRHAEFILSDAEQSEFAARATPEMSAAEVKAFHRECMEARERLRWKQLEEDAA
jgi:hypothetical protein